MSIDFHNDFFRKVSEAFCVVCEGLERIYPRLIFLKQAAGVFLHISLFYVIHMRQGGLLYLIAEISLQYQTSDKGPVTELPFFLVVN